MQGIKKFISQNCYKVLRKVKSKVKIYGYQLFNNTLPQYGQNIVWEIADGTSETNAEVDAFYFGKPVISFLNLERLNLRALRGVKGVKFVITADELKQSLGLIKPGKSNDLKVEDFFYLDSSFPRWKKLLQVNRDN